MKKKLGALLVACMICICLILPDTKAYAASGKTDLSVSSGTLNIGETVTVTAKASGESGETAYASMVLNYDSSILEFVSCSATYGGGGGSIAVASDSFSVTLKAIAAGNASISLSATDGVIYSTAEELDSMSGSSASVTVNNAASENNGGSTGGSDSNSNNTGTSNGGTNTGSQTTTTQSSDNSLKSLTISPGTLSPAFKGSTTKYTATVENSVTSIAVSAVPVSAKATVSSVTGNNNLSVGANTVSVVVKAENGTTATYTITVTRKDKAAETTDTPAETPDTPEENPDDTDDGNEAGSETENTGAAEDIVVNNTAYQISEDFTEEQIPADFSEANVNFRGQEYKGLTFDKGTLDLLYLKSETDETGKFFIYDETRDVLYDFIKLTAGENSYVIPLLAPLDSVLPESYVATSLQLADGSVMTAYSLSTEDESQTAEFYVFYGVNYEGAEGWYQYDYVEGTYQRLNTSITDTAESESTDLSALQEQYDELSTKYKKLTNAIRDIGMIIIFLAAVAAVVVLNIIFFRRKKKDRDDFEDYDLEDEDDEYDEEDEDTDAHYAALETYHRPDTDAKEKSDDDDGKKSDSEEELDDEDDFDEDDFDEDDFEEDDIDEEDDFDEKPQEKPEKKKELEIFDLNDL